MLLSLLFSRDLVYIEALRSITGLNKEFNLVLAVIIHMISYNGVPCF